MALWYPWLVRLFDSLSLLPVTKFLLKERVLLVVQFLSVSGRFWAFSVIYTRNLLFFINEILSALELVLPLCGEGTR